MGEIIMGQEADRLPYGMSSTSTADSVDIILGMPGKVVIDDVGNAFHIDSACGDIGCDEDTDPS
jgi:hypothetical protein